MLNRTIEYGLLDTLAELGSGCIAFSPLAQGMLTNKYLNGVPQGVRAGGSDPRLSAMLSEENLAKIRALNAIAEARGQTLAQMAIAWALRDERVTSALIGARTVDQLSDSLCALDNLTFTAQELADIDRYATEGGVDMWRVSSQLK